LPFLLLADRIKRERTGELKKYGNQQQNHQGNERKGSRTQGRCAEGGREKKWEDQGESKWVMNFRRKTEVDGRGGDMIEHRSQVAS